MSRKSRKRKQEAERDAHSHIASPRLSRPNYVSTLDRLIVEPLLDVEDRRTYHPLDFFRPARQLSGHPVHPVNVNQSKKALGRPFFKMDAQSLNFHKPKGVAMCVRRHQRKEVIIAKKLTKKGRGTPKRTNWYSKIGC